MNEFARHNEIRRREAETFCAQRVAAHAENSPPEYLGYPLPKLKARIAEALSQRWDGGRLEPQLELIDRETFGGDLSLKLPQFLRDGGPKGFIEKHLPWIVETLREDTFADAIESVQTRGMYINLTLTERWLLDSAQVVADLGERFGASDLQAARTILVEYSSPNVAKVLHAGHIRSTIIGHVLANLHELCGALVFRVNHINDFGGFGFTLEGYSRFQDLFPPGISDHERLLEIYRIRRTLERLVGKNHPFSEIDEADRRLIATYLPEVVDDETLRRCHADFVTRSDARFAALGAGDPVEVERWARMVGWSLTEFEEFYKSLGIEIDLVLGESFYAQEGDAVVDEALATGTAIVYTEVEAAADLAKVDEMLARESIAQAEREKRAEAIRKDVGAVVVPLGEDERYVVRRADGLSIYATRDLGAIRLRRKLFAPTDMTYVVGQEQRIHFQRLFKAAQAVGITTPEEMSLRHVYFGFYVDAQTGRKLSSRDTVANVGHLLTRSVEHFRAKSFERLQDTPEDLGTTARQLAIGSVIFNDLRQDVKGTVEIDATALDATIANFEKSGGAYVVYSACRARSILRRHGAEPERAETIRDAGIDAQEAKLLLLIQQLPERIGAAAEQSNPTLLVRHLLETASLYNSYYGRVQVIVDDVANPARLLFTKAVEQALTNGLRGCEVECPMRI